MKLSATRVIIYAGILLAALIAFWAITPSAQEKYIAENCPEYHFNPGFVNAAYFIDCKNKIGIEKFADEETLLVVNGLFLKLRNWDSFRIRNYKISGDKIYYIEDPTIVNGPTYYAATEWPDKVPTIAPFRVIDTTTTDITLYKALDDVPAGERRFFEEVKS